MQTGRSLRTLNSRELFSVGYHLLMEACRKTEEEAKVQEKVRSRIRELETEAETGMPTVTTMYKPANEL